MNLLLNGYCQFLFVSLLIFGGCQVQGKDPSNPKKEDVSVRDLYQTARSQGKILLVDAWRDPRLREKTRELVKSAHLGNWQLIVKGQDEVTEDEIANTPTMLIGAPDVNKWIAHFEKQLPLKFDENSINLGDKVFDANSHTVVLSYYPNPVNAKMPIGLFSSINESLIWDITKTRLTSFLRGSWNYEVLQNQQRILLGNFSQDSKTRWEIDGANEISLPTNVMHHWQEDLFNFYSYDESLNSEKLQEISAVDRRQYLMISDFLGNKVQDTIHCYLYPNSELKGLMTGNTDRSHLDLDRLEVHTVFDDHHSDQYFGKENELLIKLMLDAPAYPALELGLSVYFSSEWGGRGYQYWATHLSYGAAWMPITDLLDPELFDSTSPLILQALSGSMVEFLIAEWGKELFLSNYHSWNPNETELEKLDQAWKDWTLSAENPYVLKETKELSYLKGFNFTHEGYQIYNGYGSTMSKKSLDHMVDLGSNAVAIVPYSWMRDPLVPTRFPIANRPGSENDEAVIHAICEAKKLDLATMLKPHVWISGSWPGEVEMKSEEDWDKFFEYYFQWMSHYALIAEMYQVDFLCVGVEFSKATLQQEDRWVNLIHQLRKIYRGKMTYAANWGEEFENIGIWDQLDFIGLNSYYPLSDRPNATNDELRAGFDRVLDSVEKVSSKFDKPVLLTEIGFRSVEATWVQPHQAAGEKKFSENDQAMAYESVFQAIASKPVVDGIFWWKWPTEMSALVDQDRRFVPNGKMTEQVIVDWFGKDLP